MSDSTATPQLSVGERVLERDLHVEITHPSEPRHYLAVLVGIYDSHTLAADQGFHMQPIVDQAPDPDAMGVLVRWSALERHDLVDRTDDPPALAAGVKDKQVPVTLHPLSRLRSVEPALAAAEDAKMVHNEALALLLDPQHPPSPLSEINAWLQAWGYDVRYDVATETLRVSQHGQTCAVFTDGSVVGEAALRDELKAVVAAGEDALL